MANKARPTDARQSEKAVPPEWQVTVQRITKEDGRYLIYYEFAPGPAAPEVELAPAEETAEP